jgi:O-antigen biosynthesis protein WbqV
MARNMIELSGLKPDEDVRILFTGLRPGEKLHEELKAPSEEAVPTDNEKIMVLAGVAPLGEAEWQALRSLERAALEGRADEALALLRGLVEDYTPLPLAAAGAAAPPPPKVVGIAARRRAEPPA